MGRKAIFFDIDGTIWDEKFQIPESTKQAFQMLKERGHLTFLCTGRTMSYIRDEHLFALGFDGIVAGCGTYIEKDGEIIFYKKIEPEILHKTLEFLKPYHYPVILEGREYLYVDAEAFGDDSFLQVLQDTIPEQLMPLWENEKCLEVSKLSIDIRGRECREVLKQLSDDFDVIYHGMDFVELVPRDFSKATGIACACEKLGIAHEDTYAFGDSMNDYEMIHYVKNGIVMGNGLDEVKAIADYVTSGLHEDGIYNALRYYALI
ncbi:MAG: HAD family hydrolase [Lachnospiraceae bacterium]|nr:HAD family hydrolase [Lachnospiraceae bacterium]